MRSFALRLVFSALAGLAGSAAGFALYQIRTRDEAVDSGVGELHIAAPGATAALAALIGLIGGKRGPILAFIAGAGLSAVLGTKVDESIQALISGQARTSSADSTNSSHNSG